MPDSVLIQQNIRPPTAVSEATITQENEGGSQVPQISTVHKADDAQSTTSKVDMDKDLDGDDWEHSPANSRNWTARRKWCNVAIVSFYTFVAPLGSSSMAPALPDIAAKYRITNPTIVALTLSVFLISFALGPLLLAPISEMYGRIWVFHLGNLVYLVFTLGCAFSPTAGSLIAFRFLAGWAGAAPIAIGGGSISDMYAERERATAMAMFSMGPLIGPVVGPIFGGIIAQNIGFKYVFIVVSGLCSVAALIGIPLLRETYAPVIKLRVAQQSSDPEKLGNLRSAREAEQGNRWEYLWLNLKRPAMILTHSFICFILSLYIALMYGIYYIMFATFPALFSSVYHFSIGTGGLAYIGIGIGFLSATWFSARMSNKIYNRLADKNGGRGEPEMRIPALIFGSLFVPVGLFWYGWSAEARLHWIMPIMGTAIFGFGFVSCLLPVQLYLVDTFTFAASALSAASVLRSLFGFAFPLFGQQLYTKLGYGVGNSLLAGLAIVIGIPFPVWIWYKGEDIRKRSSWAR